MSDHQTPPNEPSEGSVVLVWGDDGTVAQRFHSDGKWRLISRPHLELTWSELCALDQSGRTPILLTPETPTGRGGGHARDGADMNARAEKACVAAAESRNPQYPWEALHESTRASERRIVTAALVAAGLPEALAEVERLRKPDLRMIYGYEVGVADTEADLDAARAASADMVPAAAVRALASGMDEAAVEKDGDSDFLIGYARACADSSQQIRALLPEGQA